MSTTEDSAVITPAVTPPKKAKKNERMPEFPSRVNDDVMDYEWRTGRYRTWQAKLIYAQLGDTPSNADPLIGQMATPKLAKQTVEDHNGWLD